MSELPKGWAEATVGDIAEDVTSGFASGRHNSDAVGVPHLRPMNVSRNGDIELDDVKYVAPDAGARRLSYGDVVFNNTNSPVLVGKTAAYLSRDEVAFSNHMTRVRPRPGVLPSFLARQLHHAWLSGGFSHLISNHVNQASIASSRLASEVRVRIAPELEQERIVAAIDEAFSKLAAGEEGLNRALARLQLLRSVVLQEALVGRLLPQTASEKPGAALVHDLGLRPLEAEEDLPTLPSSWCWVRLGDLAEVVGGVTKDVKRQDDPSFVEVPYLRVANVQRGYLDLGMLATIRVSAVKAEQLALQPGDVLFNEGGDRDKLGRGWVWSGEVPGCIHQNHVFRARLPQGIEPKLISWWGNTFGRAWFESRGKQTTNLASLNLTTLKSFPVPIGPFGEQARIVGEIERQLSFIGECERAIDVGLRRSSQLRKSVLKAAFEGRLASQDPGEEPAQALLDRIREARGAVERANPRQTRKVRSAP